MIELTLQPTLTKMLPELGQMVLERVIVYGKEIMVIRFLDGTEIKVRIQALRLFQQSHIFFGFFRKNCELSINHIIFEYIGIF